jgi:hypothetical protein
MYGAIAYACAGLVAAWMLAGSRANHESARESSLTRASA